MAQHDAYTHSPEAPTKKLRLSKPLTGESQAEDEEDDDGGAVSGFAKRLTQFKKSPLKKGLTEHHFYRPCH